ncbi:MAG: MFS transporter, partial [Pseudomonadota bacterium]|nr:MFS transporter [Pseudomonadota bacterium]
MLNALGLLKERRFLPLFTTQFLGAFNDNLFKQVMVLFATYSIFNDAKAEQGFNALATGLSTLPFILFSGLAGQLADTTDKARIIRIVKTAEIFIMLVGAAGLVFAKSGYTQTGITLMLSTVFLLGMHSTFLGPIKYAILPQHLDAPNVLGGTGLVEAGTYIAILMGTILAGYISIEAAAVGVMIVAGIGWFSGREVPPAPREGPKLAINWNPITSSWRLINATMHIPRLFLAICSISFFWTIGAVLIIIFPPLVKNLLTTTQEVASLFTATLSVGIAIGSVVINTLLKGKISAKYGPVSVIAMGVCVVLFSVLVRTWTPATGGHLYDWKDFIAQPLAIPLMLSLLAIAVTGGMFVVPLYA